MLEFDFPGASPARCVIEGERQFSLVITPEHAPPINPSPWYAFRYSAPSQGDVTVRLEYLGAKHRYTPKLTRGGLVTPLPVTIAANGKSASITLPEGSGTVSAQPLISYEGFTQEIARTYGGQRLTLGQSLDNRPIEAIRFGDPSAKKLIVILGHQHPPEVTGSYALKPFVRELARQLQNSKQYQLLAIPLLNPDGVARGHWRANRGGVDLNRDWGSFTQPETRAVGAWLAKNAAKTTPIAMLDFHSTSRNLFYVQGDEESGQNQRFLQKWLAGKETQFPGYAFTIEKPNANPGSGTAKNWFFSCYAIPSYTYEVGDNAPQAATEAAATALAADFITALSALPETILDGAGGRNRTDTPCGTGF